MKNEIKYGLLVSDIEDVVTSIKQSCQIDTIILFGSRAIGNYKEGSDIDIALKGENLKLKDLISISLWLDDLLLPYKFDLIIWDRIKEQALLEHIERVGVILYEKPSNKD